MGLVYMSTKLRTTRATVATSRFVFADEEEVQHRADQEVQRS